VYQRLYGVSHQEAQNFLALRTKERHIENENPNPTPTTPPLEEEDVLC
jgi:hypothetical protein